MSHLNVVKCVKVKCAGYLTVTSMNFICFGFYVTFNTVQVISRRVVERAEETSTYSSKGSVL